MPARRLTHPPATPPVSGRRDEPPQGPCAGEDEHGFLNLPLFDLVLDTLAGSGPHLRAVEAAKAVCATCPAAVKTKCLADNHDEPGVVGGLTHDERHPLRPPTDRATCGKPSGPRTHARSGEHACAACREARADERRRERKRHQARLEDLRDLIGTGADMAEVLARLGITRNALWKWCDAHGHGAEWLRLSPPKPAAIGLRARHNKGKAVA